jgi:AcrR family transcriptional regulator
MTEKQRSILQAALRLFAREGYANTSTSKVARTAGVSEGLIFRHFKNKEGLLQAILEQGQNMAKQAYADIVLAREPKEAIRKALEMPFSIDSQQHELWHLIYALKWQTNRYDPTTYDPVRLVLKNAFAELGYPDPEAEVELLFMFLDGAATALLLHPPGNQPDILLALKKKYNL